MKPLAIQHTSSIHNNLKCENQIFKANRWTVYSPLETLNAGSGTKLTRIYQSVCSFSIAMGIQIQTRVYVYQHVYQLLKLPREKCLLYCVYKYSQLDLTSCHLFSSIPPDEEEEDSMLLASLIWEELLYRQAATVATVSPSQNVNSLKLNLQSYQHQYDTSWRQDNRVSHE